MLSHIASCRLVSCPRGLTPMGWITLCLQRKVCWAPPWLLCLLGKPA